MAKPSAAEMLVELWAGLIYGGTTAGWADFWGLGCYVLLMTYLLVPLLRDLRREAL